ncbi:MAG: DMT family transporter, partial [Rhodobacteraceae bacterium]|nr:DMT family transporter [Paracoccaceae bacterium]
MERKSHIDTFGAVALLSFAVVLAFNQVVIKVTNGGFGPVFAAGLRSLIGLVCIVLWIALRRKPLRLTRDLVLPGLLVGGCFTFEFICLFIALDMTTVARASVIFYSMPVWLALMGHFV